MPASAAATPASCSARQPLAEQHVGEQHRRHRVERAEHRDEREQPVAAREREERVRRDVAEADRERPAASHRRGSGATRGRRARAGAAGERADPGAGERRERAALAAPEPEEVGEEAERDRRQGCERDRPGAVRYLRPALLGRGEHGARERERRAGERRRSSGRSPVAIEIANGTIAPHATIGETMLIVPSESAL